MQVPAWDASRKWARIQSRLGRQPEQNTLTACSTLALAMNSFRLSQFFAACESNSFPHLPTLLLYYFHTISHPFRSGYDYDNDNDNDNELAMVLFCCFNDTWFALDPPPPRQECRCSLLCPAARVDHSTPPMPQAPCSMPPSPTKNKAPKTKNSRAQLGFATADFNSMNSQSSKRMDRYPKFLSITDRSVRLMMLGFATRQPARRPIGIQSLWTL